MSGNANLEVAARLLVDKQYLEAEKVYETVIRVLENGVNSNMKSDDLAKAYNNLGFVLYKQVRFQESVVKYTKALELDEGLAASYYNRGTIHYRLGGFELALEDMKKAVALDPSNSEFQLGLQACQDQTTKNEKRG